MRVWCAEKFFEKSFEARNHYMTCSNPGYHNKKQNLLPTTEQSLLQRTSFVITKSHLVFLPLAHRRVHFPGPFPLRCKELDPSKGKNYCLQAKEWKSHWFCSIVNFSSNVVVTQAFCWDTESPERSSWIPPAPLEGSCLEQAPNQHDFVWETNTLLCAESLRIWLTLLINDRKGKQIGVGKTACVCV